MESTKNPDGTKNGWSAIHDGRLNIARSAPRQDSWVDAVVTILATVVFGLGWALVELERADPPLNRYGAITSEMWVAAVVDSIDARAIKTRPMETRAIEAVPARRRGGEDTRWPELARQRSNR